MCSGTKNCYPSKAEALAKSSTYLITPKTSTRKYYVPQDVIVYYCNYCEAYHVTGRKGREWKADIKDLS